MLASTIHWRPLVNGFSGFRPSHFDQLAQLVGTFPSPLAVARLRDLDVRYVMLHTAAYRRPDPIREALQRVDERRNLALIAQEGADRLYRIDPPQPKQSRQPVGRSRVVRPDLRRRPGRTGERPESCAVARLGRWGTGGRTARRLHGEHPTRLSSAASAPGEDGRRIPGREWRSTRGGCRLRRSGFGTTHRPYGSARPRRRAARARFRDERSSVTGRPWFSLRPGRLDKCQ